MVVVKKKIVVEMVINLPTNNHGYQKLSYNTNHVYCTSFLQLNFPKGCSGPHVFYCQIFLFFFSLFHLPWRVLSVPGCVEHVLL